MKNGRREKILEIIATRPIETQEELIIALKNSGYDVTQSTASRDIKQLGLVKVLDASGRYRYAKNLPHKEISIPSADHDRLLDAFKKSAISIRYAMNNVVIKCYSGMAQGVCVAFDTLFADWIIGSLAGDDTIIVITADEPSASELTRKLNDILNS
ncbi:MAG: arginine repressor [Acutalibacteraceae bacterium]|nr:arginine repressor [Acutalibacteraceae bacterium]